MKLNAFVPVELGLPAGGGGESVGGGRCDDGGCGKDASGGEEALGANQADGDHVLACVCSYAAARWWQTEGAMYVACLLLVSAGAPAAAGACLLFLIHAVGGREHRGPGPESVRQRAVGHPSGRHDLPYGSCLSLLHPSGQRLLQRLFEERREAFARGSCRGSLIAR